jgi:hypothetical protein
MSPTWSDAAAGGTLGEGHNMQDGPKGGSRRGVIARNGGADICDANVELGGCALDHLWACCKECGILFVSKGYCHVQDGTRAGGRAQT